MVVIFNNDNLYINSKEVLRCLFPDSGKVLPELLFTKDLIPLKKSMFVVTSQGEQIKHTPTWQNRQAPFFMLRQNQRSRALSFCNVSIGFPLLNNNTGWPPACPFDLSASSVQPSTTQDATEEVRTKVPSILKWQPSF